MKVDKFEELTFWQKAIDLSVDIYNILSANKDFWYKNQIERAVISISNNIAEWFERKSNKEFKQFLYIAKWSNWELRSMLYIWNKLWYINKNEFSKLYDKSINISKMIWWFIKSLD